MFSPNMVKKLVSVNADKHMDSVFASVCAILMVQDFIERILSGRITPN